MSKCKQSREYARTYYWANVERLRAYHREWNRRHKDVIYPKQNAAKRKERREQHEKVLAREAEYRARWKARWKARGVNKYIGGRDKV